MPVGGQDQHGWSHVFLCVEVVSKYDSRRAFSSVIVVVRMAEKVILETTLRSIFRVIVRNVEKG